MLHLVPYGTWQLINDHPTSSFSTTGSTEEYQKSCTVGMAGLVLSLLSSSWFPLDLSAHQDALILVGNLLAGRIKVEHWLLNQCPSVFSMPALFHALLLCISLKEARQAKLMSVLLVCWFTDLIDKTEILNLILITALCGDWGVDCDSCFVK